MTTFLKRKHVLAASRGSASLPFGGLVSTANLVSYWKLNETTGNRLDSFGINHLTPTNAPVGAPGKIENGCDFELSSIQYLSCPSNSTLDLSNTSFTFTGWIKLESIPAYSIVLNKEAGSFEFRIESPSIVNFLVGGIGLTTSPIAVGPWIFFAVWLDIAADVQAVQINNGTVVQRSTTLQPTATVPFTVGARYDATLPVDGIIDELGFWRRVLTPTERTALYNSGNGLTF